MSDMVITNYFGDAIMTRYFSGVVRYVALFTAAPGLLQPPSNEVSGGGYTRQTITFSSSSLKTVVNLEDPDDPPGTEPAVQFDNMPACVVTHIGIANSSTGASLLTYMALPSPITVPVGGQFRIATGDLSMTI